MKQKTVWSCEECGHAQAKWAGQCAMCKAWNSLHEESFLKKQGARAVPLPRVKQETIPRIASQITEFDRLLGGGLVKGSLTLVGGDPGIGKSTLLLQASEAFAKLGLNVLYVCGEESLSQTSLRAARLGVRSDKLLLLAETNMGVIKEQIEEHTPDIVVIDSIQIIYKEEFPSAPGSIVQVRENAMELMHIAKGKDISIFLIGHVTKSGEIAGPRILEHLVDTVLYFEGEKQQNYRILRAIKNRFGSVDEVAVFQMTGEGLSEVDNPSQIFLEERMKGNAGSAIIPTIEGTRPILIEVQALVTDSVYATPSRRSSGFDNNRLALLLAVLEKRVGYQLHNRDVFVSIAGGLKIVEPAIDLAVVLAIASSLTARPLDPELIAFGEVGLGGEVRSVQRVESRLKEGLAMGFKKAVLPKRDMLEMKLELVGAEKVEDAIAYSLS